MNNTLRRWLWQLHLIPEAPRYKENETLLEALDRHIKEIEDIAMYNQMSSGGYMNLELLKRCRSALRSCGLSGGDNG